CCLRCIIDMFFFFFSSRRRHTRCLSDWSSDVCSSDLAGTLSGLYTNSDLSGDNLNSDLQARGLTSVNRPLNVYDATATLGGPIRSEERRVGKECRYRWARYQ